MREKKKKLQKQKHVGKGKTRERENERSAHYYISKPKLFINTTSIYHFNYMFLYEAEARYP